MGWTEYSFQGWDIILHLNNTHVSAQDGSWLAWLGGDHNETSRLTQSVAISASQPYLHFWHWIASEDICGYDYARVKDNSTTVKTLNLCSTNNTGNWVHPDLNLSAYSGSTVNIRFEVTTDRTYNSNYFLDTISMSSSSTNPNIEPDEGQDLSGAILDKHHFEGLK